MNSRQQELKRRIDEGFIPEVVDATSIGRNDDGEIPFHWGDIEAIGYGSTRRSFDRDGNKYITRIYRGPLPITCGGVLMRNGDQKGDDE